MIRLKLKKEARHARVRNGHPWVFAGELQRLPEASADGGWAVLEDANGRLLGSGIVNTMSQIVWRRYSHTECSWDRAYLEAALARAVAWREVEPVRRLVWSESDDLPGLVVDQFGGVLVVQALTLAVDRSLGQITDWLQERFEPQAIIVRNDAPSRKLEGMESQVAVIGDDPGAFALAIDGIDYTLDLLRAQKTGFYLDQRPEHRRIGRLAGGRRVLDAFCNQGAFALHAAKGGALSVLGVDSSAEAIQQAKANATRNRLAAEFTEANVFDFFRANRSERYDLIILDPPSFAPNKRSVEQARRGYHELHLRAIKALNPGGILATYVCSHHLHRADLMEIIESAARDARRALQVLAETSQPADHPVRVGFAESAYLKGYLLRAQQ